MAATDRTRKGLNNQKRSICVAVSEELDSALVLTDGSLFANLPDKALIVGVYLVVTVASASSDTLDLAYNGSVVANEIAADALGKADGTITGTAAYSATGGELIIRNGAQPVDATFRGRIVVEYVELDMTEGSYTD